MIIVYKFKIANFLCCEVRRCRDEQAARDHLQRALNALEGASGPHFRVAAKVGNPCHGMPGGGVLADLGNPDVRRAYGEAVAAEARRMAELARDTVAQGLGNSSASLDDLKRTGRMASALLDAAKEALGMA
jgi:hypothetical protein